MKTTKKFLSKEEEVELIKRIRHGDEAAENELIKNCECYMYSVARKYEKKYPDLSEDIVSAGYEGMVEAMRRFEPEKYNTKFMTYLKGWIENKMKEVLKDGFLIAVPSEKVVEFYKSEEKDPAVECVINAEYVSLTDGSNGRQLCERLCTEPADIEDALDKRLIGSKLNRLVNEYVEKSSLSERDGTVMKLRFEGHSLKHIGKCIGVTGERVRQIESERRFRLVREKIMKKLGSS